LQIDELSLADNLFIDSACVRAHQHAAGAPKKGGQENQALGLCRGGFSTKIHLGRCGFANAISIVLTGGQTPDVKGFDAVFDGVPVNHSIQSAVMDKGYDSLDGRQKLQANRLRVVIPPKKNRVEVIDYDKELYKPRNRVERFINRIKQFRRIAARYDKLAETFVAFLQIVAVYIAVS
jgi:transposase